MFKFLIFMIQNTNCEINNKYFLIFLIFFKNILLYEDTISWFSYNSNQFWDIMKWYYIRVYIYIFYIKLILFF